MPKHLPVEGGVLPGTQAEEEAPHRPGRITVQRIGQVVRLGLPIMAGMSTYVLLELVDMLFVGRFGTTALASVGIAVFLTFLFLSAFGGLSVAVQATTSRLVGEDGGADPGRYLRASLVLAIGAIPPLSLPLIWAAPVAIGLVSDDPAVADTGAGYLRWLLAAGVLFGINLAFMGFWNATERPHLYLRVVILEAVLNVPLNYVLMFGIGSFPGYGVTGAGIGTFLAALVGVIYHFRLGSRYASGFHRGEIRRHFGVLLRLLVPASAQQFFDALALTLMFRIVALVGTVEVAAYSVLVNLLGVVGIPGWGLGLAGATLVGQSMGARRMAQANQWAWDVVKVGTVAMALLGLPFLLAPNLILGIFIQEADAVETARLPCQVLGLLTAVNGLGYLFASMLNGAGDVKRVMYVNLTTQYLVLLPGAYLFGVYFGFGLLGIWIVHQVGFRALNSLILTLAWRQKKWQKVALW